MTTEGLLLDTCAVIWAATDAPFDPDASEAIATARKVGAVVGVSPITAWELGLLAARGRMPAAQKPADLFEDIVGLAGISLQLLTPSILIDSSFLPGQFHDDPADRIIVSTARALELTVVTRDRAILDYARQGYVLALPC